MSREVHARFCERAAVRLRRATHLNIHAHSQAAGERVLASISRFLERRLGLNVNREKSAVAVVGDRTLGHRVLVDGRPVIARKASSGSSGGCVATHGHWKQRQRCSRKTSVLQ